jgi:hypothetical protein
MTRFLRPAGDGVLRENLDVVNRNTRRIPEIQHILVRAVFFPEIKSCPFPPTRIKN